jgi:hypothetical protein
MKILENKTREVPVIQGKVLPYHKSVSQYKTKITMGCKVNRSITN